MSTPARLFILTLVAAVLAGCAGSDGGIVGSGNRIDCEAARKGGGALPPECK